MAEVAVVHGLSACRAWGWLLGGAWCGVAGLAGAGDVVELHVLWA